LHCASVGGVVPVETRCASVIDGRTVAAAVALFVFAVTAAAIIAARRPRTSTAPISGRFMQLLS